MLTGTFRVGLCVTTFLYFRLEDLTKFWNSIRGVKWITVCDYLEGRKSIESNSVLAYLNETVRKTRQVLSFILSSFRSSF